MSMRDTFFNDDNRSGAHRIYIWAFLLPVIIMFGIFIARGIFPFGDQSFLHCDLYHQYLPFLKEFQSIVRDGGSLLYSWRAGLGTNFFAVFVYYLATPTNWLSLLVSQDLLIEFISYIVIIKTGLAGMSFAHYLRGHFKTDDRVIVLFSLGYSMSAFFAAYNWNVMWIDCLIMFPLIILGLERLVHEGRMSLYIVSLGFCIFTNFYLSIMVCIFLVLYFIVVWISAEHKLSSIARFAGGSLLAGGMASVMLLPVISSLAVSEFTGGRLPSLWNEYFNLFEAFARGLMNVKVEIGLAHWPNIYCGIAVLILIFLYLFTGNVPLRRRIPMALLTLVMLASFCFNVTDYIWHGFNYPNSLPARESFAYIFLLLIMAFEAYIHLKKTSWFWVIISGVLGGGVVTLATLFIKEEAFDFWTFACSGGAVIIYLVIMIIFKASRETKISWLYFTTAILLITEFTTNMMMTGVFTVSRSDYVDEYTKYENLVTAIKKQDQTYYRLDKLSRITQNDSMLSSFDSTSFFSSVSNALVKKFYDRNGLRCSKVFYSYEGATPVTSALMSIKYVMGPSNDSNYKNDPYFVQKNTKDGATLYQSAFYLPFGFTVPTYIGPEDPHTADVMEAAIKKGTSGSDVFDRQNALAKSLGTTGDVFEKFDVVSSSGATIIDVPRTGRVYAYVTNSGISKITALCGSSKRTFSGYTDNYIMDLGWHTEGDIITLSTDNTTGVLHTTAVMFKDVELRDAIARDSAETLKISYFTDTIINGTITLSSDKDLLFSIPYDRNWTVKVDGHEVPYKAWEETFISIHLTEGRHTVQLTYTNKYLVIGAILSCVCIGIWIVIAVYEHKKRKKEEDA